MPRRNKASNRGSTSNAGFTLSEIMVVVVIIGLLAGIAVPAYQHTQASSQDRAVMNNMRQLAAAADTYFLANATNHVRISSLVGSNAYIKELNTVAQENYPRWIHAGRPIIVTGVAGKRTLTYQN